MSIQNQKIENILNLALEVTPSERSRSVNLETGYLPAQNSWKVIVKYSGRLLDLNQQFPDVQIAILSNQYAILQIPENQIDPVSNTPYITFMEKPKRLFFAAFAARQASCITSVQESSPSRSPVSGIPGLQSGLSGKDILVGVIDSGIDYAHPDFRNPDGTTRILSLWDQTIASTADTSDEIYRQGSFYSSQTINQALMSETVAGRLAVCPSRDLSGHGTHVAGIAAGNGRASDGVYRGVAYESDLVIVKLGVSDPGGFPSTVELMEAVDYCVRFAESMQKPLALNLSFGNNYGSHSGTSLLETFLNDITGIGRVSICVGTGNEGNSAGHTGGILTNVQPTPSSPGSPGYNGPIQRVEFVLSDYETSFSLQLWKNYSDRFTIQITDPSGTRSISIDPVPGTGRYRIGSCDLLVFYGEPAPYSRYQEIYFDFLTVDSYLPSGIWTVTLTAQDIVSGIWDMWMPSISVRNTSTRFLNSTPQNTLTIPSTAAKVISVAAYDSNFHTLAAFSGRGYTWETEQIKPDLAAPGVDITSCAPGGGYQTQSGTSMATPFVTGSAALLMQYGIVNKNDPFLYGEKIKAYLLRGAKQISAETGYPNRELGWGTLCLRDSFPTTPSLN